MATATLTREEAKAAYEQAQKILANARYTNHYLAAHAAAEAAYRNYSITGRL